MRVSNGVLNYIAGDLNEKSVSGRVEQDHTSTGDSRVPMKDYDTLRNITLLDQDSQLHLPPFDGGKNSIGIPTGGG